MKLATLLLLIGLVTAGEARADEFNGIAAGCVPGIESYYTNMTEPMIHYAVTNDSLGVQASNPTGSVIHFFCPIPRSLAAPTTISMLYSRSPMSGTTINLYLMKMDKGTGAASTIVDTHATSTYGWAAATITEPWIPELFTYYVAIEVVNSASDPVWQVHYVSIY